MKAINELKKLVKSDLMLNALNELEKYKKLEEQGRLVEFPCKVGDYVEFSNGRILPVVYLTKSNNGDINVGCQNGHIVSMKLQFPGWAKRFIPKEEYERKN